MLNERELYHSAVFLVMALSCPSLTPASASFFQALKMLAIANSSDIPTFVSSRDSIQPLFDTQMTREIFASIDSATRPGSESLLLSVPAAVVLMLNTEGLDLTLQTLNPCCTLKPTSPGSRASQKLYLCCPLWINTTGGPLRMSLEERPS